MGSPDKVKKPRDADVEQQYGPADPEPANPQGAQPPSFDGDRRLTHSGTIILDEAVVGSAHDNPFPLPFNLDRSGRPARVHMSVADEQFRLSLPEVELASLHAGTSGEKTPKATVMFKPRHPGRSIAIVQFNATWEDGHSEQLEVQVIATARNLEERPGSGAGDAIPIVTTRKPAEAEPPPSLELFEERAAQTKNHVTLIAAAQGLGVDVIKDEAAKFVTPPPEKPAWMMLAELALTIGTAGVAAIVGKIVAEKAVGLIAKETAHLEAAAAKEVSKTAASATHATEHAVTHAADNTGQHAAHGASTAVHATEGSHSSRSTHLAAEGLSASVEDALKEGKPKIPEPSDRGAESADEAHSKDTLIQFFHAQQTGLISTTADRADALDHVITKLRPVAKTDPAGAVGAMTAIKAGLDAGRDVGEREQMRASASQWVAYVAQGKHGHETVRAPERQRDGSTQMEEHSVTKTDDLRKQETIWGPLEQAATNTGGVMELWVEVDRDLEVRVWGARLDGVSRLIGDRLLKMNLRDAHIPVRLRTSRRDVITVDERNQVMTGGPHQYEPDESGESIGGGAQNNRAARQIVDSVFSKTLSQWGISHISSDDRK